MSTKRKLAAILAADAAGYSKLMADDEGATLRLLNDARTLFRKRIEAHGGRLIDTAGDSILAEFPSAVEAVECAVEVQYELARGNRQFAEHRRMPFRIGINLGDVIEQEDGTIYGDGVNVAARLQALAEPGGICLSGTAYDQVEGKLPLQFKFIGGQQVKNIAKPVRAYRVKTQELSLWPHPIAAKLTALRLAGAIIGTAVVAVVLLVWSPWNAYHPRGSKTKTGADVVLAMPSGPSIAVLPFTNMSGDANDEYFSDGLTEDIITELARFQELHVLARNTTSQFKGQVVEIPEVGRKLGVGFVLEGSVRRTKDRLRITAQLIEAKSGTHVWAERFDRELKDIFSVQDEITGRVVGAIAGGSQSVLRRAVLEATQRKDPESLEAYDLVLSALAENWYNRLTWPKAKAKLERAIALDPGYARAREEYAWLMLMGWIFRLGDTGMTPEQIRRKAIEAVQLDSSDPLAHRTAAIGYFFAHELESFEREARLAFAMAPYNADIFAQLGWFHGPPGNWDRAVDLVNKGYRLSPGSAGGWYYSALFYQHYVNGRYREALEIVRLTNQEVCENQMKFILVYGKLGQPDVAKPYHQRCKEEVPEFSPEWLLGVFRTWNFNEANIRQFMDGMTRAGYPCQPPSCKLDQ